jgi:hypothetical protein
MAIFKYMLDVCAAYMSTYMANTHMIKIKINNKILISLKSDYG